MYERAFGTSLYYNGHADGCTVVASDDADLSYEFAIHLFFRDFEGRFFYGYDSGCSCPTPFEDYRSKDQFTRVFNLQEVRNLADGQYQKAGSDFFKKVKRAFWASANITRTLH